MWSISSFSFVILVQKLEMNCENRCSFFFLVEWKEDETQTKRKGKGNKKAHENREINNNNNNNNNKKNPSNSW